MSKPADRSDMFKSALSAATRALAGQDDLSVEFSVDGGRVQEGQITLTTPPRDLSPQAAARARGQADALALRVAHHDAKAHARLQPRREDARKLFEAAERARVESIGAAAMDGVAENLDAALALRCERAGYARAVDKSRAPLDDALEFVLREVLTGRKLPAAADTVANLWRLELTTKAATTLARAQATMLDQAAFADVVHDILRDLDMGDEATGAEDSEGAGEEEEEGEASRIQARPARASPAMRSKPPPRSTPTAIRRPARRTRTSRRRRSAPTGAAAMTSSPTTRRSPQCTTKSHRPTRCAIRRS
jgi:cobaltochelatase CobT